MTTDKLKYYTELLPRVNLLSLCIEINIELINSIKIQNNTDLIINDVYKVNLPIKYTNVPDLRPHIKKLGENCISLRLNANASLSETGAIQDPINTLTNSKYKWSNTDLNTKKKNSPNCEIKCLNCKSILIPLNEIRKFNAMPSEIWAEMMEFWHCHKPSENLSTPINRYTVLKPARKSMIVGSYYFLVNPNDDYELKKHNDNEMIVCCKKCQFNIGEIDKDHGNVYRLLKWNLLIQNNDTLGESETFSPFIHAYSSILDSVSSTAFRLYILKSDTDKDKEAKETKDIKALIWVFNFGLSISLPSGVFKDCLKLMFTQDSKDIDSFLSNRKESKSGINNEIDILYYPTVVIEDMLNHLNQFNNELPVSSQKMDFWKVSYLPSDL